MYCGTNEDSLRLEGKVEGQKWEGINPPEEMAANERKRNGTE